MPETDYPGWWRTAHHVRAMRKAANEAAERERSEAARRSLLLQVGIFAGAALAIYAVLEILAGLWGVP